MPHIYKCLKCNEYTLKEKCPRCGSETVRPLPPRFSPEDRYGKWRRLAKLNRNGSTKDVM